MAPESRGQGIKALDEHLRADFRERADLRGIRLYVERENLRARRVYGRLGMSEDRYIVYEWLRDEDSSLQR